MQSNLKSPSISIAFQVIPKVPDNINSYDVVDKAIEVVQKSGVKYEVGTFETTMEGQQDVLLGIIKEAQNQCILAGALEVMTYVKIHYRPSGVTVSEKIKKYR